MPKCARVADAVSSGKRVAKKRETHFHLTHYV